MKNEEQLEAQEINEKVRIVITPDKFYIYGQEYAKDGVLTFDKDALLSMAHIQEVLARQKL